VEDTIVRTVGTASFDRDVLERSHTVPVVVDFWAPWCRPCLMLGPVLERLATEANGAWELVKVNTDQEPEIAARYHIQGIPAVKGFRAGKMVDEFVGVVPERSIRAFLERVVPSRADQLVVEAQRLLEAGDKHGAEARFVEALGEQKNHPAASLGLAEILLDRGDEAGARPLLASLVPGTEEGRAAAAILRRLKFSNDAASLPTREDAKAALAANPDDIAAKWAVATRAAAVGDYEEALTLFLQITQQDRRFQDDGGRKAMLDIFAILGPEHELSQEYRTRLAGSLH
jgi:putative thioredoxin